MCLCVCVCVCVCVVYAHNSPGCPFKEPREIRYSPVKRKKRVA